MTTEGLITVQNSLDRVLVVAPYRRDAEYLQGLLAEHEIDAGLSTETDIAESLSHGPGVLVATHEAITPKVVAAVGAHLESQPAWSEMPVMVLLDRSSPSARIRATLAELWPRARLIFYERPLSAVELISGVQSALLVRLRQRDVGDHIDREIELRRELNHRVKNILASVDSIFQMTRRGATSVDDLAKDFGGRLQALSGIHSAVFHASDDAVSMREIADLTFAPYRVAGQDRISAKGPHALLSPESSTTLALCLHELATNASKYGALSAPGGTVSFTWALKDMRLTICWLESGGPPVIAPQKSGYGTRYLRSALTSLFRASPAIDFRATGLRCEISGDARGILSNF